MKEKKRNYLACITCREFVWLWEALKEKRLVLACKLIRCMYFHVTFGAQLRLVGTTNHRRRSLLVRITLNFHLQYINPPPPFLHLNISENHLKPPPKINGEEEKKPNYWTGTGTSRLCLVAVETLKCLAWLAMRAWSSGYQYFWLF